MAVIAPWLRGADVIGSASAGANVGLAARARDLQAAAQQQAADEFIAKLNQQAYQFDRNLASEHDIAASRLAQALREQDALDVYRKGELKVRNREADTHAARLLQDNMGFDPSKEITTSGGNTLVRTGRNSYQLTKQPFELKKVTMDGEDFFQTGPNHFVKASRGRTASEWNAYVDDLAKEPITESPEEKANRLQALQVARAKQKELMLPGLAPLVPQITPGVHNRVFPDTPPTTNWVQQLQSTNAPAERPLQPIKEAVGGYKVGKIYGGLKYIGGDPNDESNWQPAR